MEHWLSLTVLDTTPSGTNPRKARVHISIPKRTVKLAVARNRLKRVLREAVRLDPFFSNDRTYRLKVNEIPEKMGLDAARRTLEVLHG